MITIILLIIVLYIMSIIKIRNTCRRKGYDFNPFEENIFWYMSFIIGTIFWVITGVVLFIEFAFTYLP